MKQIQVMIVDDHQILIDGVKAMFEQDELIHIQCEALDGDQAVARALEHQPHVILLDINLPGKNGFEVCRLIKEKLENIRVIALTMHNEAPYISRMIKAGVDGYLLKNSGKEDITKAIQTVMNGEQYFSEAVTKSIVEGMRAPRKPKSTDFIQKLTRREKEVLRLIVGEQTNDQIAESLFISKSTVISHRKSLLRKLNAKNTAGLVSAAYEFGLLK